MATDDVIEAAFTEFRGIRAKEATTATTTLIDGKVAEWLRWRRDTLGRPHVDWGHVCGLGCRDHVRKIDPMLQLYGCDLSGRSHLCERRPETCEAYYVESGSRWCAFNGKQVGGLAGSQEHIWRYARARGRHASREDGHTTFILPRGVRKKAPRVPHTLYRQRTRRKKVPNKVEEAKAVLEIILWDTAPRKRLHMAAVKKSKADYGALLKEYVYVSAQNRTMICMHVLDQIVDTCTVDQGPLPLAKDLGTHARYAEWIVKMWNVTQAVDSPHSERFKVRFEQHAIGMLYRLRTTNITKDRVIILHKDPWLAENLPAQDVLGHFRAGSGRKPFCKNDITQGIKHLVMSLMLCKIPGSELAAQF